MWQEAGLLRTARTAMSTAASMRDCLFHLLQTLNDDRKDNSVMVIWALWRRRNDKVWEGVLQPVKQVANRARDSLYEWLWARQKHQPAATESAPQQLAGVVSLAEIVSRHLQMQH